MILVAEGIIHINIVQVTRGFMKTLGCVAILLLACAVPVRAAQVYSGCAVPSPTPRHVWYIDPVHGKTPAAGGNGSQASPWNSRPACSARGGAPMSQYLATHIPSFPQSPTTTPSTVSAALRSPTSSET